MRKMSKHLIQMWAETAETLLKRIAKNAALYTDANDNVKGFPSMMDGDTETAIGTVYYRLELRREPFENEPEIVRNTEPEGDCDRS